MSSDQCGVVRCVNVSWHVKPTQGYELSLEVGLREKLVCVGIVGGRLRRYRSFGQAVAVEQAIERAPADAQQACRLFFITFCRFQYLQDVLALLCAQCPGQTLYAAMLIVPAVANL